MTSENKGHVNNKSVNNKYSRMNNRNSIMFTLTFFVAVFLVLIVYLVHFVINNEQDMVNNSYNSRQEILLSQNYRGSILSNDGTVLARSVLDDKQNEKREYPFNNLFSHVVGYSTNGRMGVEAQANYYLINSNISISSKVKNDIEEKKNPGDNVYTTLDVKLQQIADDQLSIYKGAIIVSEVKTGKILALVSHPNFDPNNIEGMWNNLINDSKSSILLNRATQGMYPPGSTFKIITALEYLRENNNSLNGYSFNCNGSFKLGEAKINCYHGTSHGAVDFETSFAKSCNSSFANIGTKLDRDKFENTLTDLLFNQKLPCGFLYSKSLASISSNMSEDEIMQTSIGQGKTQITPIHLNLITNAIANKGNLMKPYVIDRIETVEGATIKSFKPSSYGRLVSEEEAKMLKELMTAVVEEGTARKLSGLAYTAAGKTGSAEYNNVKGDSHAWFTGFAPADDPEISVTIIVEGAGSGGDYAVPIARRIFDGYFNE